MFDHLPINGSEFLPKGRRLSNYLVYVSALRLVDDCLLIVASSDSLATALSDYAQRWKSKFCLAAINVVVFVWNLLILSRVSDCASL